MGVVFRADHGRHDRSRMLRVVIPSVDKPIHIVIGYNPIFWRTVAMHHDSELGREVPCRTSDCTYCPKPTREVTYVPCLLAFGNSPGGKFAPRIVPVTDGWSEILDADHEKSVYRVTRLARNQSCRFTKTAELSAYNMTPYQGQDIEESLFRMWGIKRM